MKKLTALLLALIMVMSLAACGGDKKTDAPKEETKQEETKQEETKTEEPAVEPGAKPEGFPDGNITCIVPVAAGAAVDTMTRILTDNLDLGAPIVIENLAGASQTIGTAESLNRKHDGHTFSTVSLAGLLTQPLINPTLGYDMDDFRMLGLFAASSQTTLCVRADSPIKTPEDLFDFIKNEESYVYGVANVGGITQLAANELILALGGTKGTEVVYNGSGENVAALLSGEAAFIALDNDVALKNSNSGDLRMIVALTKEPDLYFPDAPYVGQYVDSWVDMPGFKAAIMPADTPAEVFDYIYKTINDTVASDAYQQTLADIGYAKMTSFMTEAELTAYLKEVQNTAKDVMLAIGLIEE